MFVDCTILMSIYRDRPKIRTVIMKEKPERLAYRIDEACASIGIGRSSLYNMIRDGRLKSVKIAGRTLIPRCEIERLLSGVADDA